MKWWILVCGPVFVMGIPLFDPTALLKNVLVPSDAAVNSVIYRVRASDSSFSYPLTFAVNKENTIVDIEVFECSRLNSICQANVNLRKKLEAGRYYDFVVKATNQKGEEASMDCYFLATNATTPIERIFPGAPALVTVSELERKNFEVATIRARGSPSSRRRILLELHRPSLFALRQRLVGEDEAEATVLLAGPLDYEKSTVHHLTIYANDPWTELENDTRNIATWKLLVSVLDEQDTPPIFTLAPPNTVLDPALKPGDVVVAVRAEDGDRGNPRDIRYSLVSDGGPFVDFFEISDETGELHLVRPLPDLLAKSSTSPILLTITAAEVRSNENEAPSQSSSVQLALIPPPPPGTVPKFGSVEYTSTLDENSPPGTVLSLDNAEIVAAPGAVLTLQLINNNGTFNISPNVVDSRSKFTIKVRNSKLLDYESRRSVRCEIVAKEVGDKSNLTTSALLVVYLNDVNDNTPTFKRLEWEADLPENADLGATVLKVSGNDSKIKFTRLFGNGSDAFALDATGLITVAKPKELDAERASNMRFFVEAADGKGSGNTATATVIVNLIDVNDNAPNFEKNPYEFILNAERDGFTVPAFVKAVDNDTTSPNNEVRYEVIEHDDNLKLDSVTGELTVKSWTKNNVSSFHVRAYDGGVPRLWSETEIRMYPPDANYRTMMFVVPGRDPNRGEIARILSTIVGGKVTIDEVRPYTGNEPVATDVKTGDRSVVIATVSYPPNTVIDVNRIQKILDQRTSKEETIQSAEGPNLWWLFWTLLALAIILAIVAILCCICECCPWYIPPRKRRVLSAEVSRLVVKGSGQGKESKSVQVAEWFGRREAWTPEVGIADNEADSIRRHEMERGSDRGGARRMHRQHVTQEAVARDHLYIREGNADILRLVTRGNEQQRPLTLIQHDQPFIIDSGKDILLRRFIDQQEAGRPPVVVSNAVHKTHAENELEASLRQQNALLRQILMEREREMRLETQSLPAGTQTDQDAFTQTEPLFLRPPRRKTRSDNDASDYSDEEPQSRRRSRRSGRFTLKRKINTPIQEESENNVEVEKQQKAADGRRLSFGHTRTSLLRRKAVAAATNTATKPKSRSALRREVLREISQTLLRSDGSDSDEKYEPGRSFSDDSLDEVISRSARGTVSRRNSDYKRSQRYHSETDVRSASLEKQIIKKPQKSQSTADLLAKKKGGKRGSSRYMEWYTKNGDAKNKKKWEDTALSSATSKASATVSKKTVAEIQSKRRDSKNSSGPDHPLIQHSEHRFEAQINRRPEDDADSGIALTRPAMAQKKSVFTIAYNDIQTRQLRQDSATPPY